MRDSQLYFKNMKPEADVESYARSVLEQILEGAPWDSSAIALMEKTEEGYWASLDIYSKTGPFIGRVLASDATHALDLLRDDLRMKMRPKKAHFFDIA